MTRGTLIDQRSTPRTFAIVFLSYTVVMSFSFFLGHRDFGTSVVAGIVSGLVFATALTWFTRRQVAKFRGNAPDTADAPVLLEGPVNHFAGLEAVGGYLVLTHDRLLFRSHKLNLQNHETTIALRDVSRVHGVRTFGLVSNGLLIELADGRKERFVVHRRERWISGIEEAKARPAQD